MSISHSLECRRVVRHLPIRHLSIGPTLVCQSGEWRIPIGNGHRALRIHTNICSHKCAGGVDRARPGVGGGVARPGACEYEGWLGLAVKRTPTAERPSTEQAPADEPADQTLGQIR
jgi:hypothetical protein